MRIYREITPIRKEDVFIIKHYEDAVFDYPIHNHPEYELNLVLNSNGNRIVGDSVAQYEVEDLVLIGPMVYHQWEEHESWKNESAYVLTIWFAEDLFEHSFLSKKAFYNIRLLLDHSVRGIYFYGETRKKAIQQLKRIIDLNEFDRVLAFLNLLQFMALSDEVSFLASEGFSSKPEHSKSRRINEVYDFILENFTKKVNLSEVAAIANMSDSAFSHFFKKSTNKSFTQFVIDLRIGHACKLLLETKDTISQICYQCGFNNVSNFNRLFKKNRGLTPFQYRNQFEKKATEVGANFMLDEEPEPEV